MSENAADVVDRPLVAELQLTEDREADVRALPPLDRTRDISSAVFGPIRLRPTLRCISTL